MGKHVEQTTLTKQSIEDAFWAIASGSDVKEISISAIAKKAGINRSTFYAYYEDINNLIDNIEDRIIDDLKKNIGELYKKYNFSCSPDSVAAVISPYYDRMALLMSIGDRKFIGRVQREAVKLFSEITVNCDPMLEYEIVFVVSAFAGLLTYWYETGRKIDEHKFSELIHTMSIKGLAAQCTNAVIN